MSNTEVKRSIFQKSKHLIDTNKVNIKKDWNLMKFHMVKGFKYYIG